MNITTMVQGSTAMRGLGYISPSECEMYGSNPPAECRAAATVDKPKFDWGGFLEKVVGTAKDVATNLPGQGGGTNPNFPPPAPTKSNTLKIVGIGVGAAVVIGGIIYFTTRKKKGSK